jgi:YVTN family beta-propeller protein
MRLRIVRLAFLGLVCMSAFAQEPPHSFFFDNIWKPLWDLLHNRHDDPNPKLAEVTEDCVDTCRGSQPIQVCTEEIITPSGRIYSQSVTTKDYPQDPNFKCDYPEGNPGGEAVYRPSFGPIPKSTQPLSARSNARDQQPQAATSVLLPYVQLPFPPVYQTGSLPPAQFCDPSSPNSVFVVNHDINTVVRMGACSGMVMAKIPVGSRPLKIALTPDGALALVTMYDGGVAYIDTSTNQVVFTLQTPADVHPSGIDITPDGTQAYITNYFDTGSSVLVIDIAQRKILNSIPVPTFPQSVYFTPDGLLAWVTLPFNNAIYVLDTLSQTVSRTLSITSPYGLAFNSTGTRVYVANTSSNTVQVIDTATYRIIGSYAVGTAPVDVLVTSDDGFLFVTNNGGGSVSVIDLANGDIQTVSIGGNPRGLVQVQ